MKTNKKIDVKIQCLFWFLFIIGIFYITIGVNVAPDDFLLHVTVGKYILQNKAIPVNGINSWYCIENNIKYTYHEWLAGVINVFYEKTFGLFLGEWIFIAVHMFILLAILFFLVKKEWIRKSNFALTWTVVGVGTICTIASARPVWYGLSFFAITIYLLEDLKCHFEHNRIYIIGLLTIPWANLHGGSVALSYITILGYIALWIINRFLKPNMFFRVTAQDDNVLKKLIISFFLALLGSCVNPYGIHMLEYTLSHFHGFSDHEWIFEWQPANVVNTPLTFLFIVFLIGFFFWVSKNKKIEFTDFLMILFFTFAALRTYRYLPWFYVFMNFIIWKYAPENKKNDSSNCIVYGIVGVILIISSISEVAIKGVTPTIWLKDEAFAILDKLNPQRMYCDNGIGNILIHEGYTVFLDCRGDMYSTIVINDEMSFLDEALEWERNSYKINLREYMDKYDFDVYVVPKTGNINYFLQQQDDIKIVYEDELIYIYLMR